MYKWPPRRKGFGEFLQMLTFVFATVKLLAVISLVSSQQWSSTSEVLLSFCYLFVMLNNLAALKHLDKHFTGCGLSALIMHQSICLYF